mgnify:FL=1
MYEATLQKIDLRSLFLKLQSALINGLGMVNVYIELLGYPCIKEKYNRNICVNKLIPDINE